MSCKAHPDACKHGVSSSGTASADGASHVRLPRDEDVLWTDAYLSAELARDVDELLALEQRHREGHELVAQEQDQLVELAEKVTNALFVLETVCCSSITSVKETTAAADVALSAADGATGVALLRLVAAAARLPPFVATGPNQQQEVKLNCVGVTSALYSAAVSLSRGFLTVTDILQDARRSAAFNAFALALVRTQTPQACAQQLKTAVDRLKQGPVTEEERQQVEVVLDRALCLMRSLADFAHGETTMAPQGKAMGPFLRELSAALEDSCVLEHATQLLLRLSPPPPTGEEVHLDAAVGLTSVLSQAPGIMATFVHLSMARDAAAMTSPSASAPQAAEGPPPPPSDAAPAPTSVHAVLGRVLSGPCLTHAAIVAGLSALCTVDGGPAYGLPPEMFGCFRAVEEDGYHGWLYVASLGMARAIYNATKAGRLGRRGARLLLMRAAHLGLASAQAENAAAAATATRQEGTVQRGGREAVPAASAAAAAATGLAGEEAKGRRCRLLQPSDGAEVAIYVLGTVWELLKDRPAIWLAGAEEWWRNLLTLCDRVCVVAFRLQTYRLGELGGLLVKPLPVVDLEHSPPEAPPSLAAALSAGLLPGLERLVRQAAEQPVISPRNLLGATMINIFPCSWQVFAPLLAYGEPRQAAAFVVSMGKTLRHTAALLANQETAEYLTLGATIRFLASGMKHLQTLSAASDSEEATQGVEAGAGDASVATAAGVASQQQRRRRRQLGLMVSYAAAEWLPPLAAILPRVANEYSDSDLARLVSWVLLLAVRAGGCGGVGGCTGATVTADAADQRGASTSNTHTGGTGGTGEDGSTAGWRTFLLQEVQVVRLMGDALARLYTAPVEASTVAAVADAVLAVAAVFPAELRAATMAAVKEAVRQHHQEQQRQSRQRQRQPHGRGRGTTRDRASGRGGGDDTGSVTVAVAWPLAPQYLRDVAPVLRAAGLDSRADGLEALASQLEEWVARQGPEGLHAASQHAIGSVMAVVTEELAPAARLLVPPGAARRLVGSCANPGCMRLEGDSELGGPRLQMCKGCRAVGYCCRECQVAHCKAGHKAECVERRDD